jgi:hypothetical protein
MAEKCKLIEGHEIAPTEGAHKNAGGRIMMNI